MAFGPQIDILTRGLEFCLAIRAHGEVGMVSGVVTFRIFQAVLLAIGIEMRSRRFEVRSFALGVLMKVNGVVAGRQILQIDIHFHPTRLLFRQSDSAYALALSVIEVNHSLGQARGGESSQSQRESKSKREGVFHGRDRKSVV